MLFVSCEENWQSVGMYKYVETTTGIISVTITI
jgi:hypothetical protein